MTLSPKELADAWYRTDTPEDWWVGRGDLFRQLPYRVRDEVGFMQEATAFGICREHECDVLGPRPDVVQFFRVWRLDESLLLRPRTWEKLTEIADGKTFDFWLLPPNPGKWDLELLIDFRDPFQVSSERLDTAIRLAGLSDAARPAFVWRMVVRQGRTSPPYPVPGFDKRTTTILAPSDGEQLPSHLTDSSLKVPLSPDESEIRTVRAPLELIHMQRRDTDWWKAQVKGIRLSYGIGTSTEAAQESLVRDLRRLARKLPSLPPDRMTDLRKQFRDAGIDIA